MSLRRHARPWTAHLRYRHKVVQTSFVHHGGLPGAGAGRLRVLGLGRSMIVVMSPLHPPLPPLSVLHHRKSASDRAHHVDLLRRLSILELGPTLAPNRPSQLVDQPAPVRPPRPDPPVHTNAVLEVKQVHEYALDALRAEARQPRVGALLLGRGVTVHPMAAVGWWWDEWGLWWGLWLVVQVFKVRGGARKCHTVLPRTSSHTLTFHPPARRVMGACASSTTLLSSVDKNAHRLSLTALWLASPAD